VCYEKELKISWARWIRIAQGSRFRHVMTSERRRVNTSTDIVNCDSEK
jgi:hypothetical protein